jgi:hypothetical protein
MGLHGEDLGNFQFALGFGITFVIAALSIQRWNWLSITFGVCAVGFFCIAGAMLISPISLPFLKYVQWNAFVAPVTIGLVVLSRRGARSVGHREPDVEPTTWTPSLTLSEGALLVGQRLTPPGVAPQVAIQYGMNAVRPALNSGQIHAWGRPHPDDAEVAIPQAFWIGAQANFDNDYAFNPHSSETRHRIRLSGDELQAVWP